MIVYQALTGVLRQRLEVKLAATADGLARLKAVSLQTFPLVDAVSPLTSRFERKGEVHHCPLGWMSLTCRPDLSNVAFLIGSALALGIPSTIEQFFQHGGYGNLEVQLASLDHALCHASEAEGAFTRTDNKVVETICQESGRAGFKLDCKLGRVPTFPNPAWNPTSR